MAQSTDPVEIDESSEFTEEDIAAGKAWWAQKIAEFEAQFGMSSKEFLKRWREYAIAETFDTNMWAMLLRTEMDADDKPSSGATEVSTPEAVNDVEAVQAIEEIDTDTSPVTPEELEAYHQERLREIAAFEAKFGISSEEFMKRWLEDTIEDSFETNSWAMLLHSEGY